VTLTVRLAAIARCRVPNVLVAIVVTLLCMHGSRPLNLGGTVAAQMPNRSILRAIHLSSIPFAVVADQQTSRVFVVTASSSTNQGGVTVLNATSGTVIHTTPLGIMSRDGISDDILDGRIIALDTRSGRVFVLSAGPLPADYSSQGRGHVYMLDARSGRLLRDTRVGIGPSVILVDPSVNRAYVGTRSRNGESLQLDIIDATTGRLLNTVKTSVAPLAASGGVVLTNGGEVLDGRTGAVRHTVATAGGIGEAVVDERRGRAVLGESGRRPDIYVETVDVRTGRVIHSDYLQDGDPEIPLVADPTTGHVLVYVEPVDQVSAAPGFASVRDTRSGKEIWSGQVSLTPVQFASAVGTVNPVTNHFLLVTPETSVDIVHIIDARAPRILGSLRVGSGSPTIAVDAASRRVFVATTGDRTVRVLDAARL